MQPPRRVVAAEPHIQRRLALAQSQLLHAVAQHRRDLASLRVRHDLAHRASVRQQRIQILVQKGVEAHLRMSHIHRAQEFAQLLLRPLVLTQHAEAAAEPHQLSDRRVHDRHRLANAAVERRVRPAEWHIASQRRKGMPSPLAHLHRRGRAARLLLFPSFHRSAAPLQFVVLVTAHAVGIVPCPAATDIAKYRISSIA